MKIRFLFHKPEGEFRLWPPRLVGMLIVGWTWVLAAVSFGWNRLKYNYSHVELWIPNKDGYFVELCHLAKNEKGELLISRLKKYDYAGLFGFFSPFNIHDKNKWYCSEICAWLAYLLRILPKRHKRISPRRLARKLVDAGGVLKPLA